MSFAEAVGTLSFDLADPAMMLCALAALIIVCLAFDAPAIASAVRLVRVVRRRAKALRMMRGSDPAEPRLR
jgi:hypothetical protein